MSPRPYRRAVGRSTHRDGTGRPAARRRPRGGAPAAPSCSTTSGRPGKPGVGPDRVLGREHRAAEELVPDRQREAEVDVLGAVELVVDAVVVRAHEDPLEGSEAQAGCSSARRRRSRRRRRARWSTSRRWRGAPRPGISATRYDTWISGWVRKTVSTLMSSCEWWSSWKRHSIRTRWFARCTDQLHTSIATTISGDRRPRAAPGRSAGRTIHGSRRVDHVHEREGERRSRAARRAVAFTTVNRRSWRYPRAKIGRCCAGQRPLDDEEHADDRQGHRTGHDRAQARDRAGEVRTAPAARPADRDAGPRRRARSSTRGGRRAPRPRTRPAGASPGRPRSATSSARSVGGERLPRTTWRCSDRGLRH